MSSMTHHTLSGLPDAIHLTFMTMHCDSNEVLAWESWQTENNASKHSNAPSISSLMVNEKTMKPA